MSMAFPSQTIPPRFQFIIRPLLKPQLNNQGTQLSTAKCQSTTPPILSHQPTLHPDLQLSLLSPMCHPHSHQWSSNNRRCQVSIGLWEWSATSTLSVPWGPTAVLQVTTDPSASVSPHTSMCEKSVIEVRIVKRSDKTSGSWRSKTRIYSTHITNADVQLGLHQGRALMITVLL